MVSGITVRHVLRGSAAEQAGFAAGDDWLGLRVNTQAWRISKLDDVGFCAGSQKQLIAVVARDGRLLELPLQLPGTSPAPAKGRSRPATPDNVGLTCTDATATSRWLAGSA